MLVVNIAVLFAGIGLIVGFVFSAIDAEKTQTLPNFYYLVGGILAIVLAIFLFQRPFHAATERSPGVDPLRRLPRHGAGERLSLDESA